MNPYREKLFSLPFTWSFLFVIVSETYLKVSLNEKSQSSTKKHKTHLSVVTTKSCQHLLINAYSVHQFLLQQNTF